MLSVAGCIHVIRIIWLPPLLYSIKKAPIWIPKCWFCIVDALFFKLVCKGGSPRVKLEVQQRPLDQGGLALPNMLLYYAAQIQHLILGIVTLIIKNILCNLS